MERLKEHELQAIREDHAEVRQFVKEIGLKLRSRRSKCEETVSLYHMVLENQVFHSQN
jgi:hypothetical protein